MPASNPPATRSKRPSLVVVTSSTTSGYSLANGPSFGPSTIVAASGETTRRTRPVRPVAETRHLSQGSVNIAERRRKSRHELRAGVGRRDAPHRPREQAHAEFVAHHS